MVPVPNTTIVSSSGLGMIRQMSVIGRLGWGLEEPARWRLPCLPSYPTSGHSCPTYIHLFSPFPAHSSTG